MLILVATDREVVVLDVERGASAPGEGIGGRRRDALRHLQELVRNGEVGDDDERRSEQEVQKLTDAHTNSIDELLKHKETEIMEV